MRMPLQRREGACPSLDSRPFKTNYDTSTANRLVNTVHWDHDHQTKDTEQRREIRPSTRRADFPDKLPPCGPASPSVSTFPAVPPQGKRRADEPSMQASRRTRHRTISSSSPEHSLEADPVLTRPRMDLVGGWTVFQRGCGRILAIKREHDAAGRAWGLCRLDSQSGPGDKAVAFSSGVFNHSLCNLVIKV